MILDPLYFLLLAPGVVLAVWARWRTRSAFGQGKEVLAERGLTGAEAAAEVLRAGSVSGVGIEPVKGFLTDHYDPGTKVIRLSPDVYYGQSLAAVGVAAHEAGHAIQDATHYPPLMVRNGLVPVAGVGIGLSWVFLMAGFVLLAAQSVWGQPVVVVGIGAFSLTVVAQVVNLPVEFDASRRARLLLVDHGIVTGQEDAVVKRVLDAAALRYVAATLTAVLTLLYFLLHAGLLDGSGNE
jgi:Zn-dependent membrane protease YugP